MTKIRPLILTAALIALVTPRAFGGTEVFFAQDMGPGGKKWCKDYPKSRDKFNEFKARCGDVQAVDFEELKTNVSRQSNPKGKDVGKPLGLTFGKKQTATLSGMAGTGVLRADQPTKYAGAFPTSGETFMLLAGNGTATIKFTEGGKSSKEAAFGFFVTDIEKNTLQITLLRDGEADEVLDFKQRKVSESGGICFVGVINKDKPFDGVKFTNKGKHPDGFGFDDMVIAKPEQIVPATVAINAWGDVHFNTPDGLVFDYHGNGDFISLLSQDQKVRIHARQKPYMKRPTATITTALALWVDGDKVEFRAQPKLTIEVNGKAVTIDKKNLDLSKGGRIEPTPGGRDFLVYWPDSAFVARVVIYKGSHLDYGVKNQSMTTSFGGLLGQMDGKSSNDLELRNKSKVLETPANDAQKNEWGDSWRVGKSESLFEDAAPKAEAHRTPTISREQVAAVKEKIKNAGVTEPTVIAGLVHDLTQAPELEKELIASATEADKGLKELPPADKQKLTAGDPNAAAALSAGTTPTIPLRKAMEMVEGAWKVDWSKTAKLNPEAAEKSGWAEMSKKPFVLHFDGMGGMTTHVGEENRKSRCLLHDTRFKNTFGVLEIYKGLPREAGDFKFQGNHTLHYQILTDDLPHHLTLHLEKVD